MKRIFFVIIVYFIFIILKPSWGEEAGLERNTKFRLLENLNVSYEIFPNLRLREGGGSEFEIMGAQVNLKYTLQGQKGDFGILNIEKAVTTEGKKFFKYKDGSRHFHYHFENNYFILKGPQGKINLEIGNFDIRYGLLSYYDVHYTILQTLYPQNLGIKKDVGLAIFGYSGNFDYAVSITNGTGDFGLSLHHQKLFTLRLGKESEFGNLKYGVSYLTGRAPEGEMGFMHRMDKAKDVPKVHKDRYGFDIQYLWQNFTLRSEFNFGKDELRKTIGLYTGLDYEISPKIIASVKYDFWDADMDNSGNHQSAGVELSYKMNANYTLHSAYVGIYEKKMGMRNKDGEFTIQLNIIF